MRRHDTRHTRTAAACLLAALLGLAGACGGTEESDDTTAAPAASAASGGALASRSGAGTTPASPLTSVALDAAITLEVPPQDATVGRSFLVRGSGVAFEGTLLWKLADSGGGEAVSGFATAGSVEKQPFQFTVEAPGPGSYTLTVYRESAADGTPTDVVSRRLTIK